MKIFFTFNRQTYLMKLSLFTLFLFCSISAIAQLSPFRDIKDSTWYYGFEMNDVDPKLVEKLIMHSSNPSDYAKLKNYPNLKILDLKTSRLQNVPKEVYDLENLEALNLSNNLINKLDNDLKKLQKLEVLILDNNDFTVVPEIISSLPRLKCLYFVDMFHQDIDLEKSYQNILKVNTLEELRFSTFNKAKYHEIPCEITQLKKLRSLYIFVQGLTEIPTCLNQLTELEELYLGHSYYISYGGVKLLDCFPKELCALKNLKTLYLEDINVNAFPKEMLEMKNLKNLSFKIAQNKSFDTSSIKYLNNIESLELSVLYHLPHAFTELKNLKSFDLFGYRLKELPSTFGNLKNLEYLSTNTNLEKLPDSFCELSQLKEFEQSLGCELKTLPACFEKLDKLEYLNLGNCELTGTIRIPSNLRYLNLNIRSGSTNDKSPSPFQWARDRN